MNDDNQNQSDGVSTLDLMSMSVPIRRIVRLMLRHRALTYGEIIAKLDELPEGKRLTPEEVEPALHDLCDLHWLERTDDGETVSYSVLIKPKEGSETSRAGDRDSSGRQPSHTMQDLWDAVDDGDKAAEGGLKAKREMDSLHDKSDRPDGLDKKTKKGGLFGLFGNKD